MGDVLIAFLAICITCAAVLAGATSLYRLLLARASAPRRATDMVLIAERREALQQCVSRTHNWARTQPAWRPRATHRSSGTVRATQSAG
jgi:hypothetical protein